MAQAATDRAAVAHRAVRYAARDVGHEAVAGIRDPAILDLGVGDHRAKGHGRGVLTHGPQPVDLVKVNQPLGLDKAQVEHRPQGLPAGDGLGAPDALS